MQSVAPNLALMTMAQQQMNFDALAPRFARAGNSQLNEWGDNDNFDVEVLAEFLLNDAKLVGGGITFDFP